VPAIDVKAESEQCRGWSYLVEVRHDDGSVTSHTVTLAWVDHDHWTGGRIAPSRTIEAVLKYVITNAPTQDLPATFDAARARRWIPQIDRELRTAL
jgi:spore germination protein YaaH